MIDRAKKSKSKQFSRELKREASHVIGGEAAREMIQQCEPATSSTRED